MCTAGGCTWQWLRQTLELQSCGQQHNAGSPSAQGPVDASSPNQSPSHVRAAAISGQHVKQTRRLLRLFRHALAKQSSANRPNPSAGRPDSLAESSMQAGFCVQLDSTVTGADSAADVVASALSHPASVAHTLAASPSEPEPESSSTETVFLVETTVPWELAKFNTCQVPCVFHFVVSPDALSQQQLAKSSSIASSSATVEDQRRAAEQMVAGALENAVQGCKLHCCSSVKVGV